MPFKEKFFQHNVEQKVDGAARSELAVEVDLLGSIVQGDESCRFLIRIQEPG